jgi:uncharacterized protein (DUF427 family)
VEQDASARVEVLWRPACPFRSALWRVLGGVAAVLAVAAGAPRLLRRPVSRSAWLGSDRIAGSDDVVMLEGNAYFPASAVRPGVLHPRSTRSVCPWKGVARYYTVRADGVDLPDAAWSYPRPLPLARRVRSRIAFGGGVDVRPD